MTTSPSPCPSRTRWTCTPSGRATSSRWWGTGVQRVAVQSLLRTHPLAVRFFDAPAERGGWGATVVVLRRASAGG